MSDKDKTPKNEDAAAQAAAEAANQAAAAAAAAAAASAAADQASAADQKSEKKAGAKTAKAAANKRYVTTEKHSYPFDIQIAGVVLQGQWTRDTGVVMFDVPADLVAGFEKHHHFAIGNLKASDE